MSSEINVLDVNSAHWADHWLHNELRIKNLIIPACCSCLTYQWEKGGKKTSLRAESGSSEDLRVGVQQDSRWVRGGRWAAAPGPPSSGVGPGRRFIPQTRCAPAQVSVFFCVRGFNTRLHLPDSRSVTGGEAAPPPCFTVLEEQISTR